MATATTSIRLVFCYFFFLLNNQVAQFIFSCMIVIMMKTYTDVGVNEEKQQYVEMVEFKQNKN